MPCNNILFEDVALTEGDITFTCDQDTNAIGHFVRAIHTHPETGKTTEITTYIASDDRGDAFKNGIGKEIQRIFEARCDIAFARRADPQTTQFPPQWPQDTGTSDTPDRAGPPRGFVPAVKLILGNAKTERPLQLPTLMK